uniref:Uncharacterized protein n=1 Tax=Magallana gigas TaxID=29159 RepID=K1QDG1_MAGGI
MNDAKDNLAKAQIIAASDDLDDIHTKTQEAEQDSLASSHRNPTSKQSYVSLGHGNDDKDVHGLFHPNH